MVKRTATLFLLLSVGSARPFAEIFTPWSWSPSSVNMASMLFTFGSWNAPDKRSEHAFQAANSYVLLSQLPRIFRNPARHGHLDRTEVYLTAAMLSAQAARAAYGLWLRS